ncbi:MAG: hypothetical protein ACRCUB_09660 [Plesiomonas shigelloides]
MPRWYSKLRKARLSADFRKYGFIPARGRMALAQKPANISRGLELCEFDDECDTCYNPKPVGRVYAAIIYWPEDNPEADYYICHRCLVKHHHKNFIGEQIGYKLYSNFNRWKRLRNMRPDQHVCDYCDEIATGDCTCAGAEYHRQNENHEVATK